MSVDVWKVGLGAADSGRDVNEGVLSRRERERAARFADAGARRRYVLARGALRDVLGRRTARPAHEVPVIARSDGKPVLADGETGFSVSYAEGLVLIAVVDRGPVGVDVEELRPNPRHLDMAERFFCPAEAAAVRAAPDPTRAFLRFWSFKESYLKGTGQGLRRPLSEFSVATEPVDGCVPVVDRTGSWLGWTVREVAAAPGHCAAVAVPAPRARSVLRTWTPSPDND